MWLSLKLGKVKWAPLLENAEIEQQWNSSSVWGNIFWKKIKHSCINKDIKVQFNFWKELDIKSICRRGLNYNREEGIRKSLKNKAQGDERNQT